MKSFIIISLIGCASYINALSPRDAEFERRGKLAFEQFKIEHGKTYTSVDEEAFRFMNFMDNKRRIEEHNQKYENGSVSYSLGMNRFGDMTTEEFRQTMTGFTSVTADIPEDACTYMPPQNVHIRDRADWRTVGAVSPVKDQGHCGSCWAFSAVGALEAYHFRKTGKLVPLSEQNLVDCADDYGSQGCYGGYMNWAFRYIKENGIDTAESYPYETREKECRFKRQNIGATSPGFCQIQSGNEELMKSAVATSGPMAVAIYVGGDFQFYKNGFYYNDHCPSGIRDLSHAVLVVGYGTNEDNEDYWIVKNSWGTGWGKKGYVLMPRNKNNWCGIATIASFPLV